MIQWEAQSLTGKTQQDMGTHSQHELSVCPSSPGPLKAIQLHIKPDSACSLLSNIFL